MSPEAAGKVQSGAQGRGRDSVAVAAAVGDGREVGGSGKVAGGVGGAGSHEVDVMGPGPFENWQGRAQMEEG